MSLVVLGDSFETAGMRMTFGEPSLTNHIPKVDATVPARLRAAGALVLGKSNVSQRGRDLQARDPIFGPTNNPWDPARTSGHVGGAAAVAAGMSPFTVGSDVGGSLCIPAHFCGVYALRPTEHRIPRTGQLTLLPGEPRAWRRLNVVGLIARSLDDFALLLGRLAGPDGRDSDVPQVPLKTDKTASTGALRIAWVEEWSERPVTAETQTAIAGLARKLGARGHTLERMMPEDFDMAAARRTFAELVLAEDSGTTPLPEQPRSLVGYRDLLERRYVLASALEHFFNRWGVWLCPVAPVPAFPHCPRGTPLRIDNQDVTYRCGVSYCAPFSGEWASHGGCPAHAVARWPARVRGTVGLLNEWCERPTAGQFQGQGNRGMLPKTARTPDVAIVGGGIAGSSLGALLAQAGLNVVVIEREANFRDRVRGEALEPWGVSEVVRCVLCVDLRRHRAGRSLLESTLALDYEAAR